MREESRCTTNWHPPPHGAHSHAVAESAVDGVSDGLGDVDDRAIEHGGGWHAIVPARTTWIHRDQIPQIAGPRAAILLRLRRARVRGQLLRQHVPRVPILLDAAIVRTAEDSRRRSAEIGG